MPTFNAPRKVTIELVDDDGTKRIATAERARGYSNLPRWDLVLGHPSGETWPATFSGSNVVDALTELVERKEHAYNESRSRGHRMARMLADRNVPVDDNGDLMRANITDSKGRQIAFGRAAAAAARARTGGGS